MRNHLSKLVYYLGVVIIGVAFGFALQFASAAWSEPPIGTIAPGNNVEPPINIGSNTQTKTGFLKITGGGAYGGGGIGFGNHTFNSSTGNGWLYLGDRDGNVYNGRGLAAGYLYAAHGLYLAAGAGTGKVLTSDGSGNASWQTAASGADNLGNHTATQALNMTGNNINNVSNLTASGDVRGSRLCIGADCKNAWPSGGGNCRLEVYTVGGMWGTCPAGWQFIGSNNQGSNGAYCWPSPTGVALSNSNARGCGDSDVTTCGRVVCN